MNCENLMHYKTPSCAGLTHGCPVERWRGRGNVADFLRLRVASTTGTRPPNPSPFATALVDLGYEGDSMMEIASPAPDSDIHDSHAKLARWGWAAQGN